MLYYPPTPVLFRLNLFLRRIGFINQHDGNIVFHGVTTPAAGANETGLGCVTRFRIFQFNGFLAARAHKNIK